MAGRSPAKSDMGHSVLERIASHPWPDHGSSSHPRPSLPWLGVRRLRVTLVTLRIPGSPPRMMLAVKLLQACAGNMRVDLRRGDVTVPEQHLHHS